MKGWQTKKLGDVCSFLNRGVSPKYVEKGGMAVLNQRCVRDHRVSFEVGRRHDVKAKSVSNERLLQAGDVLVNSTGTGTLGRVAQLRDNPPEPTTVDSHVTIVRPSPGLFVQEFFGYMLRDIEDELKSSGEGCGGQTELNRSVLAEKFTVHFPQSLDDQERIVALLDEAFEGIATAKANAEKNLQNARALFESHLQSVFTQRGPGWLEKPLETVAIIVNGYSFKSTDFSSKQGARCIKITNVGVREFVPNSDDYLPGSFAAEYGKVAVKKGSIVLALTRTIIAGGLKVAVVPEEYDGALLNQRVASIIAKDEELSGGFLFAYLGTQGVAEFVKERVNTLMQPNLSITDLRLMPIPAPPRREQEKITRRLDSLRVETQRLARIYEQKLAALEALKKSLLHQAFTGQL